MAKLDDIKTPLTLELDGIEITPEKFLKSVQSFFAVLNEVSAGVCGKSNPVKWSVQVSKGSNLVELSPAQNIDGAIVDSIVGAIGKGLETVEKNPVEPKYFSEKALLSLQELSKIVSNDKGDTVIRIWANKVPNNITVNTDRNVNALFVTEGEEHGSVEGRLQTISLAQGLQCFVQDSLWKKSVQCYVPADLLDEVTQHFGKRVEVYGLIRYRKNGVPKSIKVEEVIPFPEKGELPSFMEVCGILAED